MIAIHFSIHFSKHILGHFDRQQLIYKYSTEAHRLWCNVQGKELLCWGVS